MMNAGQVVDNPIINDPYEEPAWHWRFVPGEAPLRVPGRRPAGYLPPQPAGRGTLDVTSEVVPLELVNDLRTRVGTWRADGYPGLTTVTKDLFQHWFDSEREAGLRPFFAQREAIETVVFMVEAPSEHRTGISIPTDEGFPRWCTKMATGAGKTLVMAMTIAWSTLNKAAARRDSRFADAVLVVCPNLTVKQRLAGLDPQRDDNEYLAFELVPPHLSGLLGRAKVVVTNWHQLAPATDPRRQVVRLGTESDGAFCQRVLGPVLAGKRRILVLNDEAHRAYRLSEGSAVPGEAVDAEQATVWVEGLARIHRDREILRCHDFSATPVYPSTAGAAAGRLFAWVVSDFALVDAVEAGLVKIPMMPTDDNAGPSVPRYRNLWQHVKESLPAKGEQRDDDVAAVTDYLSPIDGPLRQLAGEWHDTFAQWRGHGRQVPPVMIVVCADTNLAEVIEQHVAIDGAAGPELQNRESATHTLRIDSRLLRRAEDRDDVTTVDAAERVRRMVATVGKVGEAGQHVRCVISVAMLSEGWDACNVTQILGLRAFTSQLLCEQVVGRGLRRSSYDDLTVPEYVDVYGVPFQMLPFAKVGHGRTSPPRTTSVAAQRDRRDDHEIRFPRVVGIVHDIGSSLCVDRGALEPIRVCPDIDPTVTRVEGVGRVLMPEHNRRHMWERYRRQRLVFGVAAQLLRKQSGHEHLFPQAVQEVEWYLDNKVTIEPGLPEGELDNYVYRTLISQRISDQMRPGSDGSGRLLPVLDEYQPEGSTEQVRFVTSKPVERTVKSHVNYAVCDSELERQIVRALEADSRVVSYAKNDHLFCEIPYRAGGRVRRYLPDFLVTLTSGRRLLLEGKGHATEWDYHKASAARRWIDTVNMDGRWGQWSYHVVTTARQVRAVVARASAIPVAS